MKTRRGSTKKDNKRRRDPDEESDLETPQKIRRLNKDREELSSSEKSSPEESSPEREMKEKEKKEYESSESDSDSDLEEGEEDDKDSKGDSSDSEEDEKDEKEPPKNNSLSIQLVLPGNKKKKKPNSTKLSELLGSLGEHEKPDDIELKNLKDPDLYNSLQEVYNYLDCKFPDIVEIMKTPLSLEDKAELYELYENFSMQEHASGDWIEMKNHINKKFKEAKMNYLKEASVPEDWKAFIKYQREKFDNVAYSDLTLEHKILCLACNDRIKSFVYSEYKKFQEMEPSEEKMKIDHRLNKIVQLPFDVRMNLTIDNREKFLLECKTRLDSKIYGLQHVKEQLLIFLNTRLQNPNSGGLNLGLLGPPGVGKSLIGMLISECLNLPFFKVSCGSFSDVNAVKGFSYTYVGSRNGIISNALISMKVKNGVLFLDEFDKISGKVSDSFLDIVDPNQNHSYVDSYFGSEIPLDLSQLWFIFSMNREPENQALKDRIFFVKVPSYNRKEKIHILRYYSIPKFCKEFGLEGTEFPQETCDYIVDKYSESESGMRSLDHVIKDIIRKILFQKMNPSIPTSFKISDITKLTIQGVNKLSPSTKEERLPMYT